MRSQGPLAQLNADCLVNDLGFQVISYPGNFTMPRHVHAEAHIAFGLEGTIQAAWGQQSVEANPFTLTFIPMGEPHATFFPENTRVFLITLLPLWLERIQSHASHAGGPSHHQNDLPARLALRLYSEFQNQDNVTALMLEGLTLELMAQMARHRADYHENRIPRWLTQTRDLLHTHFLENLSLDQIATTVGVHPAHLTRTFRQHYQCTLGDYVRHLRIEYACHLLTNPEIPLAQIALDAGFADQGHFSRTFKNLMGMTPGQYQKVSGRAGLK